MPKTSHRPYIIIFRGILRQIAPSNSIWRNHTFLSQQKINNNNNNNNYIQSRCFADKEDSKIADIVKKVAENINEEMVKEVQAVFQFDVKELGTFHIDLKNGKGSVAEGKPDSKPDAVLTTDLKNLLALFSGNLKPKLAVMLGKLKVGGSTVQALKLEKVLPKLRGEKA